MANTCVKLKKKESWTSVHFYFAIILPFCKIPTQWDEMLEWVNKTANHSCCENWCGKWITGSITCCTSCKGRYDQPLGNQFIIVTEGRNSNAWCNASCGVAGRLCKDCVYKGVPLGVPVVLHENFPACFCTDEWVHSFVTNYFTEFLACFVSKQLPSWHWISPSAGFPEVPGVVLTAHIQG